MGKARRWIENSQDSSILTSVGLLTLRLVCGAQLAWLHGWPLRTEFGSEDPEPFPDLFGIGSFGSLLLLFTVQLGAAGLLILGLFARLSALVLSVACGALLLAEPGGPGGLERETCCLYCAAFVLLFLAGAGRFSLDAIVFRKG